MEKTSRIGEVFHRLQDPHLVARFQHICGVRGGTSARSPTGSSGGDGDRTHSHNNGAACSHLAGESSDDHDEGGCGGDPSRAKTSSTTTELRQRTVASPTSRSEALNTAEENKGLPQNGATGTATTTGGAKVDRSGMPRSRLTDETGPGGAGAAAAGAVLTKVKPLRKNSLTGDAGQEFLIENRFLYYLFTLGTELGNELFYITFFPFVSWNVDPFVGRRLIMVWVWVMYLGQCTKDILGWSRPASPPVVKVEMFYNSEYSMPSTHAMSGTAIPVCLFFLTYGRWEYPYPLGVGLALCWCLLVCASRIYMGMHSILDVMAGILYSALILLAILPALDLIDNFNLTCAYAPLINVSFHLLLGLFSFTLDTWSTSRGDTAQILGVGAGVALASHINNRLDFLPDTPLDQLPYCAPVLGVGLVATSTFKLIVGVLVLMVTRAIMKLVTIPVVCRVAGIPSTDVRKARQNMEVELPYRFIVYGAVGLNYQFLVPLLFSYMQLL